MLNLLVLLSAVMGSWSIAATAADAPTNDSLAVRYCRMIPSKYAAERTKCLASVTGQRFHSGAVMNCAEGSDYDDNYGPFVTTCLERIRNLSFDSQAVKVCGGMGRPKMLECMLMIAGRSPTPTALQACGGILGKEKDSRLMNCIRSATWQPPLAPGSASPSSDTELTSGEAAK